MPGFSKKPMRDKKVFHCGPDAEDKHPRKLNPHLEFRPLHIHYYLSKKSPWLVPAVRLCVTTEVNSSFIDQISRCFISSSNTILAASEIHIGERREQKITSSLEHKYRKKASSCNSFNRKLSDRKFFLNISSFLRTGGVQPWG